jgi:hypothetical protein
MIVLDENWRGIRMNVEDATLALHDKATRGAPLAEGEQVQLDQ